MSFSVVACRLSEKNEPCQSEFMVTRTWDTVAYPILERATQHFIGNDDILWLRELEEPTLDGVDDDLIQRELKHLEEDGYLTLDDRGGLVVSITGITPKAKKACGAWPNETTVGTAVVEALEEMAEKEESPDRRNVLRRTASTMREIGIRGTGQFFGAALRQVAGL